MNRDELRRDLASALNKHSVENESNTPDFVLAGYLMDCLDAYAAAVTARDEWGTIPVLTPERETR